MSKSGANAEPSMEEILASIRQIISDDEPQEEASKAAPDAEPELESAADEDISETDLDALFADPAPAEPAEAAADPMADMGEEAGELDGDIDAGFDAPAPDAAAPEVDIVDPEEDDILDLSSLPDAPAADEPFDPPSDLDFDDVEPTPEPEPAMEAFDPDPVAFDESEPEPEVAPAPAPAALLSNETDSAVSAAFADLANTMLSGNARTLEDLVQDMLRPMLKSWLDENLPTMVEKMVREEIERVARRGPRQ